MGRSHSLTGYPGRSREGDILSIDPEIEYGRLIADRRDRKKFREGPKSKNRSRHHANLMDLDIEYLYVEEEDIDRLYEP